MAQEEKTQTEKELITTRRKKKRSAFHHTVTMHGYTFQNQGILYLSTPKFVFKKTLSF